MRNQFLLTYFIILYCCLLSAVVKAAEQPSTIKQITDLRIESALSAGKKVILVMVSSSDCEYCQFVRQSYLEPLQKEGKYADQLLIRELLREDYNFIYDFNGEMTGGDTLALRYNIDLTPTILFIDYQGRELSNRIIGITLLDYLDMYIDQAIKQAIKKLN